MDLSHIDTDPTLEQLNIMDTYKAIAETDIYVVVGQKPVLEGN